MIYKYNYIYFAQHYKADWRENIYTKI